VASLTIFRRSHGSYKNPIIWVCHSLGGIVTKKALLYSNDLRDPELEPNRSIFVSTYALIFLGTPHDGSNLAARASFLQAMIGMVPTAILDSESVLLEALVKDNGALQDANTHFLDIYQRFKIHMVREGRKTNLKGTLQYVVDHKSAAPQLPGVVYYGIEATHSDMVKFESANTHGYASIAGAIKEWVVNAPACIQVRWQIEEEENEARLKQRMNEAMTRLGASPSTASPGTPLERPSPFPPPKAPNHSRNSSAQTLPHIASAFADDPQSHLRPMNILPWKIRPNSYSKGRESELGRLHHLLADAKRRAKGTAAVSIQSLPGGGKSHLARQYVFLHQHDYRGGIFWIPSRSPQEMEEAFWEVAKTKTLKEWDSPSRRLDLMDPHKMVMAVRDWFEMFDDWLIIFDGIRFDTPGVAEFIPNRPETSIIYTSTDRAIGGNHRFDNPVLLELERLSDNEARELLLEEMGKTEPYSKSDLDDALKAVELMSYLPLMIHVAAQHLKATREPLGKYIGSFSDRRKAGTLDAYKAVREQLQRRGETAALNLIYLLSFFGQRVPVEMISLGLKALDNKTPVRTTDTANRKSLNNTLMVLIAFALIGRNESDDSSSANSKSSAKLVDMPDRIDTLRIHGIVQAFFIDSLAEEREVKFWLERAVSLFCSSYDMADSRIQRDAKIGLPDDYRRYKIHGEKLLSYLERFGKKSETLGRSKKSLESRLGRIDAEVDALTQIISGSILSGRSDLVPKSIFEISNNVSDSDSTSNTSSSENTPSDRTLHKQNTFLSGTYPRVESPVEGHSYEPGMYAAIANVQTPYPSDEMAFVPHGYDDEFSHPGTPRPPGQTRIIWPKPASDPKDHRTVKKLEERRYHDSSGSMRLASLAMSSAQALASPPAETNQNQSGYFDAKSSLDRLHKLPSRANSDGINRASNLWSLIPRPFGRNPSPLKTQAPAQTEPQSAPDQIPSRASSRDTLLQSASLPTSAGASPPLPDGTPFSNSPPHGSRQSELPIVIHSSPSLVQDPFPRGDSTPPFHARPVNQHFRDDELLAILPPDTPPADPTSVAMPFFPNSLNPPTGYTSQPMSRNPSGGRPSGGSDPATSRRSSPGTLTGPFPVPRRRRASHVETEPSPNIAPLNMSGPLQNWQERHGHHTGHTIARSIPPSRRSPDVGTGPTRPPVGGQDMERSGSGGIVTNDGELVEFGTPGQRRTKTSPSNQERDLAGVGLGITEE
jgi:hypothetical protein